MMPVLVVHRQIRGGQLDQKCPHGLPCFTEHN